MDDLIKWPRTQITKDRTSESNERCSESYKSEFIRETSSDREIRLRNHTSKVPDHVVWEAKLQGILSHRPPKTIVNLALSFSSQLCDDTPSYYSSKILPTPKEARDRNKVRTKLVTRILSMTTMALLVNAPRHEARGHY
ncbi:hypothetical protein YC2023_102663 [Brassica napus]